MLPQKLQKKLEDRQQNMSLRILARTSQKVDFSSNDYLGLSKNTSIFNRVHQYLIDTNSKENGATGSRLLSGNHKLYETLENKLSAFHQSKAAVVYNSGYDANIGFFSTVPQRGDLVFYDEYIHASIRDGISMGKAKAYKFKHNDLKDLEELIHRHSLAIGLGQVMYVVTESVFSMDGDSPDLKAVSQLSKKHRALLVVDEAHAVGIYGKKGEGIVQELGLEKDIFARIITFGKAIGCHGAAVLGSLELKMYLVNFSRSFIYTTALSPHSVATILQSYYFLESKEGEKQRKFLNNNINFFKKEINEHRLIDSFISSDSTIQCCLVSGNEKVKKIAGQLQENGFDVRPILSPTVPESQERLRFCLHSYNTPKEMSEVIKLLRKLI